MVVLVFAVVLMSSAVNAVVIRALFFFLPLAVVLPVEVMANDDSVLTTGLVAAEAGVAVAANVGGEEDESVIPVGTAA